MRVRQWRTSRQWFPQVSTNWSTQTRWVGIGPNWEKRSAQLCTFPNMPTQANTIPAHAGTSPDMPAHSWTAVEPPSQKRKPLCERYLHRWIRAVFAFRAEAWSGDHATTRIVAKGLKSNDLRTARGCRGERRFTKRLFRFWVQNIAIRPPGESVILSGAKNLADFTGNGDPSLRSG